MKKIILLAVFVISCVTLKAQDPIYYRNAKNAYGHGTSDRPYSAYVDDRKNRFEIGIGSFCQDDEWDNLMWGIRAGYYCASRFGLFADISTDFDGLFAVMLTGAYLFDAIPSLNGGLFYNIGISAGGGFRYGNDHRFYSEMLFGPTVIVSHNIARNLSLGTRITWNILEDDYFSFYPAVTLTSTF